MFKYFTIIYHKNNMIVPYLEKKPKKTFARHRQGFGDWTGEGVREQLRTLGSLGLRRRAAT